MQREPESKVCSRRNGVWGFLPWQGVVTVECTVINFTQPWERRRRKKDCTGKNKGFFKVSKGGSKWQFQ